MRFTSTADAVIIGNEIDHSETENKVSI